MVELMVVAAIIGLLTSIALVSLNTVRGKARDVVRVEHIQQVQKALELYYLSNNQRYPSGDSDGCGTWDVGNGTLPFLNGVGMETHFGNRPLPVDSYYKDDCNGFRYYRYPAGSYGCPSGRGPFYVLGVTDMETSGAPYPGSPGWSCPGRNFQDELDWVTGSFEN
jgi:type II secretory pathway pseudopilin PulG